MTIDADFIKAKKAELKQKANAYAENQAYVDGKNPTLLSKRAGKEPDNRVPVPLAKSAIIDVVGYMGRPGDIKTEYKPLDVEDDAAADDEYVAMVHEWSDNNDDDLELTELLTEALAQGVAYELWWTEPGSDGYPVEPRWKIVPGNSIVVVYDDSLIPQMLAAVRYWKSGDDNMAMVYLPYTAECWKFDGGVWMRFSDGDIEYPYSTVPVNEYKIGRKIEPFFEAQKELIDAIDNLTSKSCNEIDRFSALVALFPGKVDKAFVDKLIERKIIDDLGQYEHWPEYLEKNLSGVQAFYTDLSNRLEHYFHKTIKVPDFSDESFASQQAGVAMAYKLLGLEFQAAMIEAYFKKGIYNRKAFFDDIFRVSTKSVDTESYTLTVAFRRNVPMDEAGKLMIALQMAALGLRRETIVKYLPASIVPELDKELAASGERVDLSEGIDDDSAYK